MKMWRLKNVTKGRQRGVKGRRRGIKRPGEVGQWQWGNNGQAFKGDGDLLKGDEEALRVTERR